MTSCSVDLFYWCITHVFQWYVQSTVSLTCSLIRVTACVQPSTLVACLFICFNAVFSLMVCSVICFCSVFPSLFQCCGHSSVSYVIIHLFQSCVHSSLFQCVLSHLFQSCVHSSLFQCVLNRLFQCCVHESVVMSCHLR